VRLVAILLLVGVLMRHASARWLADMLGYPVGGMEYMLSGAFDILLCGVLLLMIWHMANSLWRRLAIAALVIGMMEGAQITVCRACISDISMVPKGTNLCDYLVGFPMGPALIVMYAIVVCYIMSRIKET
jgi:hypothetical protein